MLECDYLVVGTGASGMAFADAIVSESSDRTVIMVDKLPQPGGHWNHAYDFVRLHQAACFYGVSSEKLERDGETALYKYKDLSSKSEILAYFRYVMDKLVKTGRVVHYPECTFNHGNLDNSTTDGTIPIQSFVDKEGITQKVRVKRRVVDATYLKIAVPSTHSPTYHVDPGVECIPINSINEIPDKNKKFIVVGSGKTGIDAILHLLNNGVDQSNISWVMPRDAWLYNRDFFNPSKMLLMIYPFFNDANTLKESLLSQEKDGMLLRLDKNIWPEKYSCATVDEGDELVKLKSIRNVIRRGRVSAITRTHLVMSGKDGSDPEEILYEEGSIIVDCSSLGLPPRPEVPIFQGTKIIIQPLMQCVICIGAAMIGYVECHEGFKNDDDRNSIMTPVPYPNSNKDYMRSELLEFHNTFMGFGSDPRTETWFNQNRLNITAHQSVLTWIIAFSGRLYKTISLAPRSIDAKKRAYKNVMGKEFEFQTYSTDKMNKMLLDLKVLTVFCWVFLIAVPISSFFGLRFLKDILYVK